MTTKICGNCGYEKDVAEFSAASTTFDRLASRCKQCVREDWQKWYYSDEERNRARNAAANRKNYYAGSVSQRRRLQRYGLSAEDYEIMMKRCKGFCEICKAEPATDIDHCHNSDKVRGLLCGACNRSLGGFKDNVQTLLNAAEYVRINK